MKDAAALLAAQHQDLDELARERSRLRTLNQFAIELLAITSRNDLAWYVAREVVWRLGFVDCVVYYLDADQGVIRQVATIGHKNPRGSEIVNSLVIPLGTGITGNSVLTKTPIIVDDLLEDDRYIPDLEPARSEICVPLIIDGEAVGAIDCEHPEPAFFGTEHLELLSTVAAMVSAKLKLISETERAERQSRALQQINDQLRAEVGERVRVEAKLRQSETLFHSVIDNSPSAIYLKDANGRFLLVNRGFEEWFGTREDEIVGKTATECFESELVNQYMDMDREVMDFDKVCEREVRTRFSDGTCRRLLVTKFPVRRPDGVLDGVGTISIDITERKLAEEQLQASEERLKQATALAKIGYWVWDVETDRCLFCSEEHARHHGLTSEQYVDQAAKIDSTFTLTHPEDRGAFREALVALRQGAPIQIEYRTLMPDGGSRFVREVARPVFDREGNVVQEIGSSQDITESKLAEERLRQAQKMEAVGQLTGGVAHDFNNLLAVIQGDAELLGDEGEDVDELRDGILRAAERGAALTQRLLAFSRQQPLRPQEINLVTVVRGLYGLVRRVLGEAIEIDLACSSEDLSAFADVGQLENALLNLTINARDAMPEGGTLTITCDSIRIERPAAGTPPEAHNGTAHPGAYVPGEYLPGEYVRVAVGDNGCGMAQSILQHVFEPFFTTKGPGEGSGLGLSMVYGFAKQSGGHVAIDSTEGRGTTVGIYLPRHSPSKSGPPGENHA